MSEHDCGTCTDCIHDGNKCCGCYDGACCRGDEACRRCGGPNVVWSAPSPLWNYVMRENDINGPIQYADLVCIRCFLVLAEAKGVDGRWRLSTDSEPDGLLTTTPSGRAWNPETWLWESTYAEQVTDFIFDVADQLKRGTGTTSEEHTHG